MFVPTEGENCILLDDVIAMTHADRKTTVYHSDGRTEKTGFRPVTLKARYVQMLKENAFDMKSSLKEKQRKAKQQ